MPKNKRGKLVKMSEKTLKKFVDNFRKEKPMLIWTIAKYSNGIKRHINSVLFEDNDNWIYELNTGSCTCVMENADKEAGEEEELDKDFGKSNSYQPEGIATTGTGD